MRALPRLCLAVLPVVMGCAATTPPKPDAGNPDVDAGVDAGLAVVVDTARAVTAQLDATGGQVTVELGDGRALELTLPPDALAAPTSITVTPVVRIDGLPSGVAVVAAAQLGPDGLLLRRPASLRFPEGPAGAFAFQWAGAFDQAHHTPFERVDGGVVVTVTHFSGAGLATGDDAFAQPGQGTTGDFVAQYARLLAEAKAAGVLPWYDGAYQARFASLWVAWARGAVEGAISAASAAPAGAPMLALAYDAGRAALVWWCAMRQWESGYFEHRGEAPPGWQGPLSEGSWSGDWTELGLAAGLGDLASEVMARFESLIAYGIQDPACRALGQDPCSERPYVERAVRWAELAQSLMGLGRRDLQPPDLDAYCERATSRYVQELAIVSLAGEGEALALIVGDGAALGAGAVTLTGGTLSGPFTWASSAPEVASVKRGAVHALSPGSAVITVALAGDCIKDTLNVNVRPRTTTTGYALSGELTLGGAWVNGCPPANVCNYCTGGDYVTAFGAVAVVTVTVEGGSGHAIAWLAGEGRAGCGTQIEVSGFLAVEQGSASMVNGETVHLSLGALTISGRLYAPDDAPHGSRSLSGSATYLPFSCACFITTEVNLVE